MIKDLMHWHLLCTVDIKLMQLHLKCIYKLNGATVVMDCEKVTLNLRNTISETKLLQCNQDQIRNQRPRLRRDTLILVEKAMGCETVPKTLH